MTYKSIIKIKPFISLLCLLFFIFINTGCSRLRWLDYKLGEGFNKIENSSLEEIFKLEVEKTKEEKKQEPIATSTIVSISEKLTPALKEEIDNWLNENALNRYGDSLDSEYTGGTPLVDDNTGKSIERYYYILINHPELLELAAPN